MNKDVIESTSGVVVSGAKKVLVTQKTASARALETIAGENVRDAITAVIHPMLPVPKEYKEMLSEIPVLDNLLCGLIADLVNNFSVKSRNVDKMIMLSTSATHVDALKTFNVHLMGQKLKDALQGLNGGDIFNKMGIELKEEDKGTKG